MAASTWSDTHWQFGDTVIPESSAPHLEEDTQYTQVATQSFAEWNKATETVSDWQLGSASPSSSAWSSYSMWDSSDSGFWDSSDSSEFAQRLDIGHVGDDANRPVVDFRGSGKESWSWQTVSPGQQSPVDQQLGSDHQMVAWQAESSGGGRGYVRTAKRLAVAFVPLVAIFSLGINVLLLLYDHSVSMEGTTAVDSSRPANVPPMCRRRLEQYLVDIDQACCEGEEAQDLSSPWCSVASPDADVNSNRNETQLATMHSLYVCTDRCSEVVLPLWSQCIQPELLEQYPMVEESPAWLFEAVVSKCSQPAERRKMCVDNDSLTDPFSHKFLQSGEVMNQVAKPCSSFPSSPCNQSSNVARSLCGELRAGLVTCDDLLGTDGEHSYDYPQGWYDDACCRTCPVYWPRALLEDSSRHGYLARVDGDMFASKQTFVDIVAALEQQEMADEEDGALRLRH